MSFFIDTPISQQATDHTRLAILDHDRGDDLGLVDLRQFNGASIRVIGVGLVGERFQRSVVVRSFENNGHESI